MIAKEFSKLKRNKVLMKWIGTVAMIVLMFELIWTLNDIWTDFSLGMQIMLILIPVLILVLFNWDQRPKVFRKWS
jgi:hypothetical protein